MARDATYDMEEIDREIKARATSEAPRMGVYSGVIWRDEGDEQWFRTCDVMNVLSLLEEDLPKIDDEVRLFGADDQPVSYVSSSGLAQIVDSITGFDIGTMRKLWISAWYEDLTFHVEGGEGSPDIFACCSTGDFITGLIDENVKSARKDLEAKLDDLRSDVRTVLGLLHLSMDVLENAVTYLDGYRNGLLVASGDDHRTLGICDLFTDLQCVEDGITRVNAQLEDMAGGVDDD